MFNFNKLSSSLAFFLICEIFALKSLILFTLNRLNMISNLLPRSKLALDLLILSKLYLKKFSKNKDTA